MAELTKIQSDFLQRMRDRRMTIVEYASVDRRTMRPRYSYRTYCMRYPQYSEEIVHYTTFRALRDAGYLEYIPRVIIPYYRLKDDCR